MAPRIAADAGKALYLYGVTEKEVPVPKVLGVDGNSAVQTISCGGLVCWISWVSGKDFADNLAANMENLDWLAQTSVQHQRVVSAIAQETDILPTRFGTVFLSEASLQEDVRKNKRFLLRDFARIRGCDEFGVKVFGVPPKVDLPAVSSRSGKDYLKAKAALLQQRPARNKASNADFEELRGELESLAVDTAEAGKISGGQRGLQWQTSLLLRRVDRKKFDAILRKYSKQWAGERQIECTGPWPAYSFVSRGNSGVSLE